MINRISVLRRNNFFVITIILILGLSFFSCARDKADNQADKPYVVILSIDGCRWDYPDIHDMTNLNRIGHQGVKADAIIPSYPSKTFPNHYTLATGLYPDHHGIVSNNFYDPDTDRFFTMGNRDYVRDSSFWGGEPIWATAEKQGVKTASFFWVGTETNSSHRPSIRKYFDDEIPFDTRVDSVVSWLYMPEETRPHLILFYFEEPDAVGHGYGPESKETKIVLARVDSLIGVTMDKIKLAEESLDIEINFIVTSDHGMGYIPESQNIILNEYIDLDDIAGYAGSNPAYLLQPEEGKMDEVYSALSAIPHLKVWTKDNVPEHYHYGTNNRIFDLVVEAEAGWGVNLKERSRGYSLGTHGYDPANKDMHAIFYAMGPAFKSGYTHSSFDNVCLYSLLAEVLKLEPVQTDGELDLVRSMLKD